MVTLRAKILGRVSKIPFIDTWPETLKKARDEWMVYIMVEILGHRFSRKVPMKRYLWQRKYIERTEKECLCQASDQLRDSSMKRKKRQVLKFKD